MKGLEIEFPAEALKFLEFLLRENDTKSLLFLFLEQMKLKTPG
jgi:hypothetical protein